MCHMPPVPMKSTLAGVYCLAPAAYSQPPIWHKTPGDRATNKREGMEMDDLPDNGSASLKQLDEGTEKIHAVSLAAQVVLMLWGKVTSTEGNLFHATDHCYRLACSREILAAMAYFEPSSPQNRHTHALSPISTPTFLLPHPTAAEAQWSETALKISFSQLLKEL
ncbi:hypothetical protein Baya_0799 [Bagarius yarrelli]|uniref:Uncharacterized protein n=1 Tax=Bagarius yarrelli TaxID=175774 RepID=A0A556TJA7_BAGYA|nr:hypothetical protein Baya_0799 [Bagarius yarrelli]